MVQDSTWIEEENEYSFRRVLEMYERKQEKQTGVVWNWMNERILVWYLLWQYKFPILQRPTSKNDYIRKKYMNLKMHMGDDKEDTSRDDVSRGRNKRS